MAVLSPFHQQRSNRSRHSNARIQGEGGWHVPPILRAYVNIQPAERGGLLLSYFVWWTCIGLEVTLLIRGRVAGLFTRYPLFYSYIGCVLLKELAGVASYALAPNTYPFVYWPTELITVVASFAVIVEMFRGAVRHNPGFMRFVQNVLLAVFSITTLYACIDFSHRGFTSIYRAIEQLGRELRLVEGALLMALLWLLVRYRIELGRNLGGAVVGYSFLVGVNLINFAFLPAPSPEWSPVLRMLIPVSYATTLVIWCSTLWSAQGEATQPQSRIEHDYEFVAAKTRALLARTSDTLTRAIEP